jgi:tripartite-type tricarboxylate transporter receptor subunit TctC
MTTKWPAHAAALLIVAGLGMALAVAAGNAKAQSSDAYSRGPVKIVVSTTPGTVPDVIARTLAQGLQEVRGGSAFVVENKVGAQGMLAGDSVARSAPDGATLLLTTDNIMTVLPNLQEKMPFNPLTDLTSIGLVANAPYVLVVHPSLKVRTLGEFIALAKARPDSIEYATIGVNSAHNFIMSQLAHVTGIQVRQVPYGKTSPIVDVLAGQVPSMWSGLAPAIPQIKSGKLVALAVSGAHRQPSLPDVPTVAELGYGPFNEVSWFGIVGPAGMSPSLVSKISKYVAAVVGSPAFRDRMSSQGMEPRTGSAEDLAGLIKTDYEKNKSRVTLVPMAQ